MSLGKQPFSARDGASGQQKALACLSLALPIAIISLVPKPGYWLSLVVSPFFLAVILVQLAAAFEAQLTRPTQINLTATRSQWPRFSVLVPLYHEPAIARQLVSALEALDYPRHALEIFFLLEADDTVTAGALIDASLPDCMTILSVPPGIPRTKPRALNHGLLAATGTFITVFDAEDIPDPDQLKKAVIAFEAAPADVLCLQARLAIDNVPDGWLALMAAIEYAALFDSIRCGLAYSAQPVPLGGTSNHFRRQDLVRLGGWDPWNVTEDADLGLRIARQRGLVMDLLSTTQEEAPVRLVAWMNQRRRWLKGWVQTGVCHTREPMQVIREMGFACWIVAVIQVGGMVFGALTFPIFITWIGFCAWTGSLWEFESPVHGTANAVALAVFLTGTLAMFMPAVMGLRRRRQWHLMPWLLTLPLYLVLVSAAAWLALLDLFRRPFHWLKTTHGQGTRRPETLRNRR